MADYPSVPQVIGTVRASSSGLVVERAVSGKPRFRRYFSQFRYGFKVRHDCDDVSKGLIEAHYAAHRMLEFDLDFAPDGLTYQVQYANVPSYTPSEGEGRWIIESTLVETSRRSFGLVRIVSSSTITVTTESTSKFVNVAVTGSTSVVAAGEGDHTSTATVASTSSVAATGTNP